MSDEQVPRWFTDAPAAPVEAVHGGGAHAHWWDHIAPLLSPPPPTT